MNIVLMCKVEELFDILKNILGGFGEIFYVFYFFGRVRIIW